MENLSDFWNLAFGGKDNLKLFLEARNFRIRKNKKSTTASFYYPEGRIIINILHLKEHDYFTVCRYDGDGKTRSDLDDWLTTPDLELVSECIEHLTGKVLEF